MTRIFTHRLYLLPALFLAVCACNTGHHPSSDTLREKAAPFDQFSFQRSYPDRDFDWRGWRKTMRDLRVDFLKSEAKKSLAEGQNPEWTIQGPGNVAGRVNTIAVKPGDENTVLAGFAGGGIFKSTDGGANWKPVFDDNLELAIGDIEYDPNDPSVVYAGTGDPNMPSIVYNGNGVYKSTDGGETWQYSGLGAAGIISKIVIDPADSQTLYAATMGNPYVRDNERGVYKSTDGGETWQQILFVSNQAGASDLVMSVANPQILYASFWDRIRNNHESIIYGPNAGVYKSTDGGAHWQKLAGGLPSGTLGRTGLAVSQQNPDKVYAIFMDSLSTPHSMHKSVDGGQSWTPINVVALEDAVGGFGWYFAKIRVDPKNDEDLYFLAIILWRRPPGNSGWQSAANSHADCHELVFASTGKRYLGCDGGVYRNTPGQMAWIKSNNLPTTQFYHTNYNPHEPNVYYAGAQDNGIRKGSGTLFNGWTSLISADGFRCMFDPNDPNVFWVETQNGEIHKTIDGGNNFALSQPCLGTSDRCNWDTPYFLSKHNPGRLFAGTYRVYFSDSGGGWGTISGDLTDGIVYEPRFHTVSCLDESPVVAEKLLAGTSDGNVWRREPAGNWTNITAGLPDRYVTSVHYSPSVANRIFVTHSGFRDNEYIPHVHRSDNNGASWTDIGAKLPNVPVNDLFILPGHADSVLFAATDAGVYVSLSAGVHWQRLGALMPFIPVFDLEINPVRKELVAATFARGIWTFPLDEIFNLPPAVSLAVTGSVKTETGQSVASVRVCDQPAVVTQADGVFQIFSDANCLASGISPKRNDNPLNGVSTFDLVLINKHILGVEALNSPYKMIAADANNSRSITTFDIVTVRKLILGIDSAFANTDSWRFLPADYVFPNAANPFEEIFPERKNYDPAAQPQAMDFVGVKTGDVNGNAEPGAAHAADIRGTGAWTLHAADRRFEAGESPEFVLSADPAALVSVQFTLLYDADVLELLHVEPMAEGLQSQHLGIRPSGKNCVSVAWENARLEAASGRPFYRIAFRAKKAGNFRQHIRLADQPTFSAAFLPDGTAFRPTLNWLEKDANATCTVRVFPNPCGRTGATFEWQNGDWADGTLRLFSPQGRLIFQQKMAGEALTVPATTFATSGVYYYEMRRGEKRESGKLVFNNTL